jgi:hypothetical protein
MQVFMEYAEHSTACESRWRLNMNTFPIASQPSIGLLAFKIRAKKILFKKIFPALVESVLTLVKDSTTKYHREQHYMRGPGPKWHAKHAQSSVHSS